MKHLLLFACIFSAGLAQAQICNPNPPDPTATQLGFNPNPLPAAVTGSNYTHQNTVVLPGKVDNTLTPTPGDSIDLCGVKILSVSLDTAASYNQSIPAGFNFNWAAYQGNTEINASNSASTPITIAPGTSLQRVCLRLNSNNVPSPVNTPCDTVYFKVDVRGRIDLGIGCNDVPPPSGDLSFYIAFPVCASAGIENQNGLFLQPMFPNPANTTATLNFSSTESGAFTFLMNDASGRVVNQQSIHVPTAHLASGLYLYSLEVNGVNASGKVLVQHD
jgi:hypothetical protein